ncbi:hypothetical protein BDB00DRAFT_227665 [Zychaea mexicana]|uniref:uncharacterized protein n=1 Tax=Zychaea mexicana TaxID=64656 RepID=UPI0022FE33CB|nr:uncharacterized protein BDB00DRAFT_227665 [Zychaea mexicana]KAI9499286.1 hypothetical protein BDB00DRAFT_227665 [Zychaea mexicana]
MPMVNFPPTFQHPLIASSYTLLATLNNSCKSQPLLVYFEPCVETSPYAKIRPYIYRLDVTRVSLLTGLHYQLNRDTLIRIRIESLTSTALSVSLKQHLNIVSEHTETIVVASVTGHDEILELRIPDTIELPTVTDSRRFGITYKLHVSTKRRYGPIFIARKLFEVPITVGTLPHGTGVPTDLLSYSDDAVALNMTTRAKPKLSKSSSRRNSLDHDTLPVYDEFRPPGYSPRASFVVSSFPTIYHESYHVQ